MGHPALVRAGSNSQYPGAPRYHQAYMLVQDGSTGSTAGLPANCLQPAPLQPRNKYRHPAPLNTHLNPFTNVSPIHSDKCEKLGDGQQGVKGHFTIFGLYPAPRVRMPCHGGPY